MKNALIRNNIVVNVITSGCPNPQDYQAVVEVSSTYCEPGWLWNGGTSFARPPLPPEVVNEATLRDNLRQALSDNKTLLAIANPTNAQLLAQIKPLTRQVDALIRLASGQLDDTT